MTAPASSWVVPEVRHVELPGVRLAYRDTGGSGVPIMLLHAFTGTSASWAEQFGPFAAAGYRVVAPDRRGWGESVPDASTGPQPGCAAGDLLALVEQLRLGRFHLVAVAAGGFVALDYAAWRPDTLRTLTVAATQGGVVDDDVRHLVHNIEIPGFDKLPQAFREIGPSYRALYPERVAEWSRAQQRARRPGAVPQPPRTPNTLAKLATIRVPTLAITASADLLAPPALMSAWLRHLPDVEVRAIADAGHSVPMEQPESFNEAVLDFLRRY